MAVVFGRLCGANEGVDRDVQQNGCSYLVAYVLLMKVLIEMFSKMAVLIW